MRLANRQVSAAEYKGVPTLALRMIRSARVRSRSQKGVTLVEVLLTMAIIGIVIGPLTAGFIVMMRGQETTRRQLDRSADAARIGNAWTIDVQNVDPDGVNSDQPCRETPIGTGGVAEVDLVTFTFNSSPTLAASPEGRATWVAVGTGKDLELHRRYCEGGIVTSDSLLASAIGRSGVGVTQIVHGPLASPNQMVFCPAYDPNPSDSDTGTISDRCTIIIDGDFDYNLTVERRVPENSGNVQQVPPPAPVIVAGATQARNTYITVGWIAPTLGAGQSPIVQYKILIFTDPAGNGTPITAQLVSGTASEIHGLTNFTDYYVRVQAINQLSMAGEASDVFGPLTPQPTGPDAPTITGTPVEGDTEISLSWLPNANYGGANVTSWIITATPGSGPVRTAVIPHVGGQLDAQTGTVTGLTNGEPYTLTVIGENSYPGALASDPTGTLVPYGVPSIALNVAATSNPDGTVTVTWNSPIDDGGRPILGYRIILDAGPAAGPWPSSNSTVMYPTSPTSQTLGGLTLGQQYVFRVLTYNLRGYSTSMPSEPPILSAALPGAPPSLSVSQNGAGGLLVSWGAAAPNGSAVTNYEVMSVPVIAGTPVDVGTALSRSFTGLASGTTYTFYVRAKNVAGWGPSSSGSAVAPGAPDWQGQGATVVRQSGNTYPFAFTISWNRPPNTGGVCVAGYRIEYSVNGSTVSSSNTITATPGAYPGCSGEPSRSFSWTGIAAGPSSHYFRVVAWNTLGATYTTTTSWASRAVNQTCTVTATEDSWVNESDPVFSANYRNNNYGGDSNLDVNKGGNMAFIKFNPTSSGSTCSQFGLALPSVAEVESGNVQLYNNSPTSYNRDHEIHRVDSAWTEYGITYNNRPGASSYSDTESSADGGWRTWSVWASDIQRQRDNSTRFGWRIRDNGGNIFSDWANYDSRENSSKPRLNIVFH